MSFPLPWSHRRCAFTLVELLAVIGIIGILIALLLPMLQGARRHADRVNCLSNLRQLAAAAFQYANDNGGYWPPQAHGWTLNGSTRSKKWHDFLSKYVVGGVVVDVNGVPQKGELNFNGTQDPKIEPQIISPEICNGSNALWGCPTWNRVKRTGPLTLVGGSLDPGYGWTRYPFAPADLSSTAALEPSRQTVVVTTATTSSGVYAKVTQYRQAAQRALILDSVSAAITLRSTALAAWPYEPETATAFPRYPDAVSLSIDFNRHGKLPAGNKASDASVNVLYCDGHAAPASARDAWRALRFN